MIGFKQGAVFDSRLQFLAYKLIPILNIDLNPPPLVEDLDRFYRSREKIRHREGIKTGIKFHKLNDPFH